MTYQEIIAQIARRLGHNLFEDFPKADYRYALKWAEMELVDKSDAVKDFDDITLTTTAEVYALPTGFHTPIQWVCFDENSVQVELKEVDMATWLSWNPTSFTEASTNDLLQDNMSAEGQVMIRDLRHKVVIAILNSADTHQLYVKPMINGTLRVYYSSEGDLDPFNALTGEPPIPKHFHQFLISGAVSYLAQIEAASAMRKGDTSAVAFFMRLQSSTKEEFEKRHTEVKGHLEERARFAVVKNFTWFDKLEKYR